MTTPRLAFTYRWCSVFRGAHADHALAVADEFLRINAGLHGNAAIEHTLNEIGRQARTKTAFVLSETLAHEVVVPFHHIRHPAPCEYVVMGHAIGHLGRQTRSGLPFTQGDRREWHDLEHAPFGNAVVEVPVIIIGAIADNLHLQADPVLKILKRQRRVDHLVEDGHLIRRSPSKDA